MIGFFPEAWRTPVFTITFVALALLGSTLFGEINARSNLDGLDTAQAPLDVTVRLDFEPERFHLEAFQDVGRYQGWSEGRAIIRAANPDKLARLARKYWVSGIDPLEAN